MTDLLEMPQAGTDMSSATASPWPRATFPQPRWLAKSLVCCGFLLAGWSTASADEAAPYQLGTASLPPIIDPRWEDGPTQTAASSADTPHGHTLDAVKSMSGLTWEEIALVLDVTPRTLHLWRHGGGIRDVHRQRLDDLRNLLPSIGDTPAEVRSQLIEAPAGEQPSMLARLAEGATASEAAKHAPWRNHARRELDESVASFVRADAMLHEDFAFLARMTSEQEAAFLDATERLLSDPRYSRSEWEAHVDRAALEMAAGSRQPYLDTPDTIAADADDYSIDTDFLVVLPTGGAMDRRSRPAA